MYSYLAERQIHTQPSNKNESTVLCSFLGSFNHIIRFSDQISKSNTLLLQQLLNSRHGTATRLQKMSATTEKSLLLLHFGFPHRLNKK